MLPPAISATSHIRLRITTAYAMLSRLALWRHDATPRHNSHNIINRRRAVILRRAATFNIATYATHTPRLRRQVRAYGVSLYYLSHMNTDWAHAAAMSFIALLYAGH